MVNQLNGLDEMEQTTPSELRSLTKIIFASQH